MWPESGSGFEADPFSPAGAAQREWMLTQRMGRSRWGRVLAWFLVAAIVGSILAAVLSSFH
jgi:hypothetical protein